MCLFLIIRIETLITFTTYLFNVPIYIKKKVLNISSMPSYENMDHEYNELFFHS